MTTKEQERKALEQIKKIVESLGENSYVGTAFEGCYEIAKENIENDFGESMKDRWLTAERKYEEACGEIENLKARLKWNEGIEKRLLSADEAESITAILRFTREDESQRMKEAASEIVKNAENPAGIEFKKAVTAHRASEMLCAEYDNLIKRTTEIMNA